MDWACRSFTFLSYRLFFIGRGHCATFQNQRHAPQAYRLKLVPNLPTIQQTRLRLRRQHQPAFVSALHC
jgi:hypothetical protein